MRRNGDETHGPANLRPKAGCGWDWLRLLLLAGLAAAGLARLQAQVVPAGNQNGFTLAAGATASGFQFNYGSVRLVGPTVFVDADVKNRLGIEGEAHWLEWNQTAGMHAETYSVGPRFHLNYNRLQPYAKILAGVGVFHYPYGYATDTDFVLSAGGGLDYRLTRRVRLRVIDAESQLWPQFNYGALRGFGLSAGLRIRIR